MYAVRARGRVTEDRRREVEVPPEAEAGEVEVIVLYSPVTIADGLVEEEHDEGSELFALWADREDIDDAAAYARELRWRAQRSPGPDD